VQRSLRKSRHIATLRPPPRQSPERQQRTVTWNADYFTTLVAIAGTTISPYLFFWQAAQEAEEVRIKPQRQPLLRPDWQAPTAFARIRADTAIGMGFSNLIAVAIIITTAATVHAHGVTNIQSSSQSGGSVATHRGVVRRNHLHADLGRAVWCLRPGCDSALFEIVEGTDDHIELLFNNVGTSTRGIPFEDLTLASGRMSSRPT